MNWHGKQSRFQTERDLIATYAAMPEIETVRQRIEISKRIRQRRLKDKG
jgi:hypothetical protein